jgi:hypothetical protein
MTGRLTAAQPLIPFGTLGCDCTYTTHPGGDSLFAIGNWPAFTLANITVDIVNAIKALDHTNTDSLCGTLSDLVANNAFSGSFTVTPSVTLSDNNLVFSLTGTYTLTLSQTNSPFISRSLPAFSMKIPTTTRWTDLPSALETGLGNGASTFAQDLLGDPAAIAVFLAVVVGPKATAVALELACKGLVDETAPTATDAANTAFSKAGGVQVRLRSPRRCPRRRAPLPCSEAEAAEAAQAARPLTRPSALRSCGSWPTRADRSPGPGRRPNMPPGTPSNCCGRTARCWPSRISG